MARLAGRVLRLLGLRPGELPTVALLFTWSFAGVGAIWLARAVRDTLFLANVSAAHLPYMYVASPITVSLIGLGYARWADGLRRERLVVGTAIAFALYFAAVRLAIGAGAWLFYLLYVSVDVLGSLVAMQLWTVAGDALNVRDGKRLFGLIAAGGTVANIVLGFGVRPIAPSQRRREPALRVHRAPGSRRGAGAAAPARSSARWRSSIRAPAPPPSKR